MIPFMVSFNLLASYNLCTSVNYNKFIQQGGLSYSRVVFTAFLTMSPWNANWLSNSF